MNKINHNYDKIRRGKKVRKLALLLSAFGISLLTVGAIANPIGGNVSAGNITIQQAPGSTTINQTSGRGIINWQSFNINSGERTHFNQPLGGVTLNRISPLQGASQIYGRLTATGQIILINPAGIYFEPGAYVNVGGLIASTAGLSDKDFMAGNYHFIQDPRYNGAIINQGTLIAANNGLIALMGNAVQNDGTIEANLGTAVLGSGREFSLTFNGDDEISFTVQSGSTARAIDKNGNSLADGVRNNGRIIANGGRVIVTAQAASGVLDNAINMRGYVEAKSVSALPGGGVVLGANGTIRVAANVDTSSTNFTGNNVNIEAPTIILESPSLINASGALGGGNITIGRTADSTLVQPGATLLSKSISGNGGLVETSGHQLTIDGIKVDTSSLYGKAGNWLLDPTDFTINAATASTLISQLNTGNVTVLTTSAGTGGNGDIIVASNLLWNAANSLTLSAYRNITINASVGIGSSNTNSTLTLKANNTGAFNIGSGGGLVTKTGTINHSGAVDIFYNPSSTAYNPNTYANAGQNSVIGTVTGYMYINIANQLGVLRSNSGLWGRNFALSTNINASTLTTFAPIGTNSIPFTGKFNGLGKTISQLTINNSSFNTGLFGVTGSAAVISNLTLSNISINGTTNVGAVVGNNAGTISNVSVIGGSVTANGNNLGGIVGLNAGTVSDVMNLSNIIGTSVNNVGGIIGNNSGTLNKALSVGLVLNGAFTGGVVGRNSGTVLSSFWDTGTTGKTNAVGVNTGSVTATAGCFAGGTCANGGTANLSTASTYTNAGWDLTNTWGITEGISYVYPRLTFTVAPQIISGQIGQFTSYYTNSAWATMPDSVKNPIWTSFANLAIANQKIDLLINGSYKDSAYSNANGSFYYLEPQSYLPTGQSLSLQLTGSSNKANLITVLPVDHASIVNLPVALNTVNFVTNGKANRVINGLSYLQMNSSILTNAFSTYSPGDTLFTVSGNNTSVKDGYSFVSAPAVDLLLRGDLSTTNGSLTFNGVLDISPIALTATAMNATYNVTTNLSGNIYTKILAWAASATGVPGNFITLNLTSANNIILARNVSGYTRASDGTITRAGSLNLSAAYTEKSITTDSDFTLHILNFNLLKGKWYQDKAPFGSFAVLNNFQINSGIFPSPQAEFIRVAGGDGTVANPWQVNDLPSLQGIGSSARTLNAAWIRDSDAIFLIDRTILWNNGAGFVPIGTAVQPFTGSFNGNSAALGTTNNNTGRITGILINRPNQDNVGLFGVTGPTANIFNVSFQGNAITGHDNVGFIGLNQGAVENVSVYRSFTVGNNNVGTIAGTNLGNIKDVSTFADRLIGNRIVGGVSGVNAGTIKDAIIANYIGGNTIVGGLVGLNTGLIQDSFWDKNVTGVDTASGLNLGKQSKVYGGCLDGVLCTVNLSNPKTYLSFKDGGFNLVSQSWDFNNHWDIIAGYSYPMDQVFYAGTGARVFSGKLLPATPNEILAMYSGSSENIVNGSALLKTKLQTLITGADGSFYNVAFIPEGHTVVITANSGSVLGSIAFVVPAHQGASGGSIQGLTLNTIPNPNPIAQKNLAYAYIEIQALFQGIDPANLSSYYNPATAGTSFRNLYKYFPVYTQVLNQYVNQASGSSLGDYYFVYSGGNQIQVFENVDQNIRDIIKNTDTSINKLLDSYDVKSFSKSCQI